MRFQKVATSIWTDEKFKYLSSNAQLLFFYILTNPHSNMIGVYALPYGYITGDLGFSKDLIRKCFSELIECGMMLYDAEVALVALPNYLKWNPIKNKNMYTGAISRIQFLPKSPILKGFTSHIVEGMGDLTKDVIKHIEKHIDKHVSEHVDQHVSKQSYTYTSSSLSSLSSLKTASSVPKKEKENGKIRYGEFVQMTKAQYDKLVLEYGEDYVDKKILELNEYLGSTGRHGKYKRHDYTIRAWLRKEGVTPRSESKRKGPSEEEVQAKKQAEEDERSKKLWDSLDPGIRKQYATMAEEELRSEFPEGFVLQPLIRVRAIELYQKANE